VSTARISFTNRSPSGETASTDGTTLNHFGLEITSDQLRMTTECWAEFHGLVALEVNGHIVEEWVDPAALFDANMIATIRRIGFELADATDTTVRATR
jgi:hypothetical protein